MHHYKHRMAGAVEERDCQKCKNEGMHYTLIEHKTPNKGRPMIRFEAVCMQCGYNWVETYEMVPNSWMYEHE